MSDKSRSHTILIVDDEPGLRRALKRSLARANCRTETASSAAEALVLLRHQRVDLVITDLVMPGMDGIALVRKIKGSSPNMKIIIITAYGSDQSVREAESLGVSDYLTKPFDLSLLKSKVDTLLSSREASDPFRGASDRWKRRLVLRSLCSTSGRSLGAASTAIRRTLHYATLRTLMLGAGRVSGTVSGMRFGMPGLAATFRRKRRPKR